MTKDENSFDQDDLMRIHSHSLVRPRMRTKVVGRDLDTASVFEVLHVLQ